MAAQNTAVLGHNRFGYDEEIIRLREDLKLTKDELRDHSISDTHKFRPESNYENVETVNKNLFLIYARYFKCNPDILRDMLVTFTQREFEYLSTITEVFQCTPPVCNLGMWLLNIAKVDTRGNELVPFILSLMGNIHTTIIYKNGYLSTVEDAHSRSQEEAIKNSEIILVYGGRNFYMEMVPRDTNQQELIETTIRQRFIHTDLFQWLAALGPEMVTRSKRRPTTPNVHEYESDHKPNKKKKKRKKRRTQKPKQPVTATRPARPQNKNPTQPKPNRRSVSVAATRISTRQHQTEKQKTAKRRSHKLYTCTAPGCNYASRVLRTFNSHCRSKHGNIRHTCAQCGKSYKLYSSLKRHIYEHQTKRYYCKKCGATFRFTSELKTHMAEHNRTKRFKCKICGMSYQLKNGLTRHMSKHSARKWACESCNYRTSERRLLRLHKISHTPLSLKCDQCEKMVRYPNQLRRHKKKDHGA